MTDRREADSEHLEESARLDVLHLAYRANNTQSLRLFFLLSGGLFLFSGMYGTAETLSVFLGLSAGTFSVVSLCLVGFAMGANPAKGSNALTYTLLALAAKLPIYGITAYFATRGGISTVSFYLATVVMVYSVTVWRLSRGDAFTRF